MRVERTEQFKRDFDALPDPMKKRFEKQLRLLIQNPRHPSLRTKKMEDPRNVWECRITKNYRFTFQIREDAYVLRRVGGHDILRTP